jgi:hypothetical protein
MGASPQHKITLNVYDHLFLWATNNIEPAHLKIFTKRSNGRKIAVTGANKTPVF